jgi:iron complex outermembrane recepter protein
LALPLLHRSPRLPPRARTRGAGRAKDFISMFKLKPCGAAATLLCLHLAATAQMQVAAHAGDDGNKRDSGIVNITGQRLGTLPTQIPTTIEGITAEQIAVTLNATDSADALKYFPSLLVRKRYIGDYDHAVLSSRASGTGNSARSLVYADGILLSNLLGNGASFTPRWGLVTPEEIERVDVLYGPFSAAYPGNSVGAVVDYITRMPERFEAHAKLTGFRVNFDAYGQKETPSGGQASASLGSRHGDFAWWFNVSRQDSESQALVYVTKNASTAAPAANATVVTGAIAEKNRFNQDWLLLGTTNHAHTVQDHAKLKLQWRASPTLRLAYTLALWDNDAERDPRSWLRDGAGQTVEITPQNWGALTGGSRPLSINGNGYTLTAADAPRTREHLMHVMHGLTLRQSSGGVFDWQVSASAYRYEDDAVRSWSPVAGNAAAGRLTDLQGTGWMTFAARGTLRLGAPLTTEFGLQHDAHQFRNKVFTTTEWTGGPTAATPLQRFEGNTTLTSLWGQGVWSITPLLKAVVGLRAEQWEADRGITTNGTGVFSHPQRDENAFSPKLAVGYQVSDEVSLKASTGKAVRFPTVSELFQGSANAAGQLTLGDPNLAAEVSWTTELSADWASGGHTARATLFHEGTRNALYSQLVPGSTTVSNIQNVERIRTQGIELAAGSQGLFLKSFDLSGSLTFADSIITANARFPASVGKWQPRVPRWRANLLATWRATEDLTGTLGVRYGGKQFNSLDNTDPNGARYQGASPFTVADVRVRWKATKQWSAAFGIDNVTDRLYWNFHPYPGRTFVAELKFDL